ncbi:LytTR family DNA-binding domain-containing protein [Massilia sp. CF038]|uniref:LytR/AlgR family response regulator transcription factor n=1 Tax=Massilia sp. CF038 TaxID=1881045 RepID=UPI0009181B81|nr:LytTR family DNA-binding domain-containing protein [Massilia sp. CF038]SHH72649.1 two component transcriptional regulator, LytTR family [Massilia sp. CF038]
MRQSVDKPGPSALIVEDEPALADELHELLATLWPELQIIGHAHDGVDALRQVARVAPDIVFLDIQIPDPNGLDVARMLRDRCHIVFVTAYDVHALEAFDSGAVDYILKPIHPERMALTVRRLRQRVDAAPADLSAMLDKLQARRGAPSYMRWITASVGSALRLIMIDDVLFFQSEQKYTRVVLADSEVLIKKTIKELVAELDPEQFWQTHRSTIVNAAEIASIEPNMAGQLSLKLRSRREQLPVAESFVRRFRQM